MSSKIADSFKSLLDSLAEKTALKPSDDISFLIYRDLLKIREAQWHYKTKMNREIDYSTADIFQDILAHYIRSSLSKDYTIHLELKVKKLRPDILIKKNGVNWAIIEVKTNIGWDRDLIKDENYLKRLNLLGSTFNIPLKRIFYIFESSANVSAEFSKIFKSAKQDKIKDFIFPLFENGAVPYYLTKDKSSPKVFSEKEIFDLYNSTKITPFSLILDKITA
ncbi:MAG TPA: hypothetical protein VHA12_02240 [Candidatus Nanoarchaeia archaeon]|nr:hypothetical protein [Candidatus Nanoarchaeia archaeon]